MLRVAIIFIIINISFSKEYSYKIKTPIITKEPYIQREYSGAFMGGGVGLNFSTILKNKGNMSTHYNNNGFAFTWLAGYQYIKSMNRSYNFGYRIYGSYDYMNILGVDCNLLLINADMIFDFMITNNFLIGLYLGRSYGVGATSNRNSGKQGGIISLPILQLGLRFNFLTHNALELGVHSNIMFRAIESTTQTTRFLIRYIYSF